MTKHNEIVMIRPVYFGYTVLELCELLMYEIM